MTFIDYPIKKKTYPEAVEAAALESVDHPEWFIYLYRVMEGGYVIDFQGLPFSNEKLLMMFYDGEATIKH